MSFGAESILYAKYVDELSINKRKARKAWCFASRDPVSHELNSLRAETQK